MITYIVKFPYEIFKTYKGEHTTERLSQWLINKKYVVKNEHDEYVSIEKYVNYYDNDLITFKTINTLYGLIYLPNF